MFASISRRTTGCCLSHFGTRPALTVLELICAIVVLGILGTGGVLIHDAYGRAKRADRVAEMVRWEITVARSYAVRSGRPMTLLIDEHARSVSLRDGRFVQRTVSLGDGAPMSVETLRLEIPGDSLVFSPRGVCLSCSSAGTTNVLIEAQGRSATVRVGRLGAPQVTLSSAAGGD